jgi:hypothetical protein
MLVNLYFYFLLFEQIVQGPSADYSGRLNYGGRPQDDEDGRDV